MFRPPYITKPQQMLPQQQSNQQQQEAQRSLQIPPGLGKAIHQSPAMSPMQQPMDNLMQHHTQQQEQHHQQQQYFPQPYGQFYMDRPLNHPTPGMPLFPPDMDPFFPPPHLFIQHTLVNNFSPHQACPLPHPHLPIVFNNFAMHPNFDAIHAAAAMAGGIHPSILFAQQEQAHLTFGHVPTPPPYCVGRSGCNCTVQSNANIQQNHPLQQNATRRGHPSQNFHQPPMRVGNNNLQTHAQQRNTPFASHRQKQKNYNVRVSNGNLPPENGELRKGYNSENYHGGNKSNNNNVVQNLKLPPCLSSPSQFKKLLGKVHHGSFIATRKIIDAEIVISDTTGANTLTKQSAPYKIK